MATEYLQAIDFGDTVVSGGQGLADRINGRTPAAQARVEETFPATVGLTARNTGVSDATGYVLAYEGTAIRNVEVNNIAYRAGFLANNTTEAQVAIERAARTRRAAASPASAGTGSS